MERLKFIIKNTIKQLIIGFITVGAIGLIFALYAFSIQHLGFIKTIIIGIVGWSVMYSIVLAFCIEGREK